MVLVLAAAAALVLAACGPAEDASPANTLAPPNTAPGDGVAREVTGESTTAARGGSGTGSTGGSPASGETGPGDGADDPSATADGADDGTVDAESTEADGLTADDSDFSPAARADGPNPSASVPGFTPPTTTEAPGSSPSTTRPTVTGPYVTAPTTTKPVAPPAVPPTTPPTTAAPTLPTVPPTNTVPTNTVPTNTVAPTTTKPVAPRVPTTTPTPPTPTTKPVAPPTTRPTSSLPPARPAPTAPPTVPPTTPPPAPAPPAPPPPPAPAPPAPTPPPPPAPAPPPPPAPAPPPPPAPAPPSSPPPPAPSGELCGSGGHFTVNENTAAITDPRGRAFLPMGINITAGSYRDGAYWQNSSATAFTADDAATLAKTWKFNTVRLNVNSVANPNIWFDAELDRVIGLLTDAGIVAMVENHPFGTGFDPTSSQITTTAQGFATLAKRWADNPCVWFNPYNEPGGKLNASVYHVNATDVSGNDAWVDWHVPVIDAIRAKSEHAVIVLDDTHFGQARAGNRYDANQSASLVYGPGLNQKFDNLVYSVHFYDRWGGSKADLGSFFASAKAKGLAIVAGEAGGHPTLGPWYVQAYWPTATALFQMRQPGVGILLWHGNQGYQSGMSVGRDFGRRTAVWDVTTRSDTEASGTLLWDWTHNPPSATP